MAATKLNIHFHNPNSAEDTYKIVSGVLSEMCEKKIKTMIVKDSDKNESKINCKNLAS